MKPSLLTIMLLVLAVLPVWAVCPAGAESRFEPSPAKCRLPVELLAAPGEEFPPPPDDDRGYDVTSYDLEVLLDPLARTITGTIDIGLTALADGKTRVRLDLVDELTCNGIRFRGAAATYTHQGDSLVVDFTTALNTAAPETLTVSWNGRPPVHGNFNTGLMFRTNENGTPDDPSDDVPMIANQNQPWSAHSWWPCKDHPSDKALVSLAATVPEELLLISNGTLVGEDSPAPGLRRFAWREAYPIATYLVSLAATNFVSWSEDCAPGSFPQVRLDYHVFPQDRANAEIDLEPTCDMLELMTELAGPYPFAGEKYAQVEYKWFGSMEHQTATSLSPIIFRGDRYFELVIIHELAHQWFGDSLTPDQWSDIWLNEGFARYLEALWIEDEYGQEDYRDYMRAIGVERHPDYFADDGVLIDPDPILPNTLIYDKGAWVLHMLRMWIGKPAFREFLFNYATAPELALGSVTLADMIGHAEAAAGRDLDAFFDPWLTTSAVPVIRTEWNRTRPGLDGHGVSITLTQEQSPLFEVAVPVVIHSGCQTIPGVIRMDRSSHTMNLETPCRVDSVTVDPEGMVLMRTQPAPPAPLQVDGPWPNPVSPTGGKFSIYLTAESEVVVKMYDIRGRLLNKDDLGTLPVTGPSDNPDTAPHIYNWPEAATAARLASGVYWLEFEAAGSRITRKLTFID
jgi:aminopeptidase N